MNRPVKKYRCGPVSIAIWQNSKTVNGKEVIFDSITFEKAYLSNDGWQYTTSFSPEDLPRLQMLATEAYRYLELKDEQEQRVELQDERE